MLGHDFDRCDLIYSLCMCEHHIQQMFFCNSEILPNSVQAMLRYSLVEWKLNHLLRVHYELTKCDSSSADFKCLRNVIANGPTGVEVLPSEPKRWGYSLTNRHFFPKSQKWTNLRLLTCSGWADMIVKGDFRGLTDQNGRAGIIFINTEVQRACQYKLRL